MGCVPRNSRHGKWNLRNFPSMPRSRSNEKEFSHWNRNLEYSVVMLRRPTWSGIRTSGTILARQIHAALRNPHVPLGGKSSCDSGQRHSCHWVITATSRHAAHGQPLTATGRRVALLGTIAADSAVGVCERVHGGQEIRYLHPGIQHSNKISRRDALPLGDPQYFGDGAFYKLPVGVCGLSNIFHRNPLQKVCLFVKEPDESDVPTQGVFEVSQFLSNFGHIRLCKSCAQSSLIT